MAKTLSKDNRNSNRNRSTGPNYKIIEFHPEKITKLIQKECSDIVKTTETEQKFTYEQIKNYFNLSNMHESQLNI